MKDKELRKEAQIQRTMCEGICDRCREKLQWRFKYDKYKPLTKPGNCQKCRNKTVTKAYRIYCDRCATADGVCASCAGNLQQLRQERLAILEETERVANEKTAADIEDDLEDDEEDEQDDDMTSCNDSDGGDGKSIDEQFEDNNDNNQKESGMEAEGDNGDNESSSPATGIAFLQSNFASDKNMRIIESYGASKYNKNRVVGQEEAQIPSVFFLAKSSGEDDK